MGLSSPSLSETELRSLGLERDPFAKTDLGGFFFSTPALSQRLDLLHHLVQYGELLLLVVGPQGAGKTTLVKKLLAGAGEHWRVCAVDVRRASAQSAPADAPMLLQRLCSGFELSSAGLDESGMWDCLSSHLEALKRSGQIPVIAVDCAENLSQQALALVSALSAAERAARVILICKPETADMFPQLDGPGSAGGLTHTVDVPPLTAEQVGDYLHLRLNAAGLVGDDPFTDSVVQGIYKASHGRPGAINPLARQVLTNRAANGSGGGTRVQRILDAVMTTWGGRIAAGVVALGLLGGAVALFSGGGEPEVPKRVVVPLPTRPPPSAVAETETLPPAAPPVEVAGDAQTRALPEAAQADPTPLDAPRSRPLSLSDLWPKPEPPTTEAAREEREAAVVEAPIPQRPAAAARAPVAEEPEPPPVVDVAATPKPQPPATPPPPPPKKVIQDVAKPVRPAGPAHDISWLRRQNPDHFTIQLLGTHSRQAMEQFLNAHGLGAQAAWFRGRHRGQPWYVVVFGVYPNREAAAEGMKRLPAALRRARPWMRTIASILENVP